MSKKAWKRIRRESRRAAEALEAKKMSEISIPILPWWWYLANLWRFWQIPRRKKEFYGGLQDIAEKRVRDGVKYAKKHAEKRGYREGVHHVR